MRRAIVIAAAALAAVALVGAGVLGWAASRPPAEEPLAKGTALFVIPHPDDESYGMASAIARQTSAGRRTVVVLLTDGESSRDATEWAESSAGRDIDGDGDRDRYDFGLARRAEFASATAVLGVKEVAFLGSAGTDGASGLRDGHLSASGLEPVVGRLIGRYGATAVFTTMEFRRFDPIEGDVRDHPDHRACARSVHDAASRASVPAYFAKIYVYTWPGWLRFAPLRAEGDAAGRAARRSAIDAYSAIGRSSTPVLWDAAHADPVEYLVPGDSF